METDKYKFFYDVSVRLVDVDQTRYVNYSIYLSYLEDARIAYWAWLFGRNITISGLNFITANVNLNFRHPTSWNEKLRVFTRICEADRSSIKMDYKVYSTSTSKLILDGSSIQVLYDHKKGTKVPIPDEMRQIIKTREIDIDSS